VAVDPTLPVIAAGQDHRRGCLRAHEPRVTADVAALTPSYRAWAGALLTSQTNGTSINAAVPRTGLPVRVPTVTSTGGGRDSGQRESPSLVVAVTPKDQQFYGQARRGPPTAPVLYLARRLAVHRLVVAATPNRPNTASLPEPPYRPSTPAPPMTVSFSGVTEHEFVSRSADDVVVPEPAQIV
jgi:hypothetical protein